MFVMRIFAPYFVTFWGRSALLWPAPKESFGQKVPRLVHKNTS